MRRLLFAAMLAAGLVATVSAQSSPAAQAARQWRQQHERPIVEEFMALLAIPNVSRDTANIQRNADAIRDALIKRGVDARLVSLPGANPVVFGEIRTPGATRTIGFYAHYDGQPLDPKEWTTPPFTPTLRDRAIDAGGTVIPLPAAGTPFAPESRIYARGAADDKAPIIAQLAALDAIRAAGLAHRSNIKFMFEGEEEAGSPNLMSILEANRVALCRRHLADVRRAGPPEPATGALFRLARRCPPRSHGLRSEERDSQRALRQLGAQPGVAAVAPARVDEERVGPGDDRRVLRRCRSAERCGAEGRRRSAERRS